MWRKKERAEVNQALGMVLEHPPARRCAVTLAEVVEPLDTHLLSEVIHILAPLTTPVSGTVGIQLRGLPVKAHDDTIHMVSLCQHLNDRHGGVEIEGAHHEHFLVLLATLAIGQFNTVV